MQYEFKPGQHVRFKKKYRDYNTSLAKRTYVVTSAKHDAREDRYLVYMTVCGDGRKAFDFAHNLELVHKVCVRGNELCFETQTDE